jgi:hypothetical protein
MTYNEVTMLLLSEAIQWNHLAEEVASAAKFNQCLSTSCWYAHCVRVHATTRALTSTPAVEQLCQSKGPLLGVHALFIHCSYSC